MGEESFSRRFGHRSEKREIVIREEAPPHIREAILMIAQGDLDLRPSDLRGVLCRVLRKIPDQSNWSEYPNIWGECQYLLENCPWYKVYDFVEALYDNLYHDRYRSSDDATR
jgi:hypothetical protein